ncbi:MAG TPA: hypothetical protein DDW27_00665 [Bacteroidales bacterium]|nr:hypothetical protein [Bacteroidales bacterium]
MIYVFKIALKDILKYVDYFPGTNFFLFFYPEISSGALLALLLFTNLFKKIPYKGFLKMILRDIIKKKLTKKHHQKVITESDSIFFECKFKTHINSDLQCMKINMEGCCVDKMISLLIFMMYR